MTPKPSSATQTWAAACGLIRYPSCVQPTTLKWHKSDFLPDSFRLICTQNSDHFKPPELLGCKMDKYPMWYVAMQHERKCSDWNLQIFHSMHEDISVIIICNGRQRHWWLYLLEGQLVTYMTFLGTDLSKTGRNLLELSIYNVNDQQPI